MSAEIHVGDMVTVVGRGLGLVTREWPGWLRVALHGVDGLPQDYRRPGCHPTGRTESLEGWCWCGDRLDRHVVPCRSHGPQEIVTSGAGGDRSAPPQDAAVSACELCGGELPAVHPGGLPRRYCSTRCRVAAHRAKGAA